MYISGVYRQLDDSAEPINNLYVKRMKSIIEELDTAIKRDTAGIDSMVIMHQSSLAIRSTMLDNNTSEFSNEYSCEGTPVSLNGANSTTSLRPRLNSHMSFFSKGTGRPSNTSKPISKNMRIDYAGKAEITETSIEESALDSAISPNMSRKQFKGGFFKNENATPLDEPKNAKIPIIEELQEKHGSAFSMKGFLQRKSSFQRT